MEQAYKQYFDAAPCYLTVQSKDLRIVDANKRFRDQFGQYEGRYCYQVYKQRAEKCERCPVERSFRDGEPHSSEEHVKTLEGKVVSVLVNTTPIFGENGEIESVMEMSTDITEIKMLQQQLRDSQQRYRLIFDEVPCFISIQDRDLRIVDANQRFVDTFGVALGCKCFEVYKHRQEECYPCSVQKTFRDGKVHRSEEVITAIDGRRLNTLVYTAPVRSLSGEITHVLEMSTDITPIRQLQSQLESIGLLISSISHGIKGLLTGLDGGIYLVNTGLANDNKERTERGWEMVQRNVDRIRDMVLNILFYAKEREPELQRIDALELGQEVSTIVSPKACVQGVEFEFSPDSGCGHFDADAKSIRSLLVNLLENSIDACRVDKKKDRHIVTFKVRGNDDSVFFDIEDNGIGMDRETREKAFSLFFSSKGSEGTGLGLFISNNIANSHGGAIEVDSELNRGTHFHVRIPRQPLPG